MCAAICAGTASERTIDRQTMAALLRPKASWLSMETVRPKVDTAGWRQREVWGRYPSGCPRNCSASNFVVLLEMRHLGFLHRTTTALFGRGPFQLLKRLRRPREMAMATIEGPQQLLLASLSPKSSPLSSSPLPSPTAVLRQISRTHVESEQRRPAPKAVHATQQNTIWEIPDSQDEERLSPAPKAKTTRKRAVKSIAVETATEAAGRKTKTKTGGALKTKRTNRDIKLGLKSKYFGEENEKPKETEKEPVRKTVTRKKATSTATVTAAAVASKKRAAPKGKAKQIAETSTSKTELLVEASLPRSPVRRKWTPVEDTTTTLDIKPSSEASAEPTPEIDFGNKIGVLAYRLRSSQEREQFPIKAQPEKDTSFTRKRQIEVRSSLSCRCHQGV
jgi:hypothetical protein